MHPIVKNILGSIAIAALGVAAYAGIVTSRAYDRSHEATTLRSFYASADGKSVGIPDIAEISFSVITEGGLDVTKLQGENTQKSNAIMDYLKSQNVAKEDIVTQGYNIYPRYNYYPCKETGECPPPDIIGYSVNQSVRVKLRNFDTLGDVLAGVTAKGANEVSGLTFTIDDPTALENTAREEAIVKAKEKAQAIASASGITLGRLLSISDNGKSGGYPMPYYADSAVGGRGGAAESPSIAPGSQEIIMNVTLEYEIVN